MEQGLRDERVQEWGVFSSDVANRTTSSGLF